MTSIRSIDLAADDPDAGSPAGAHDRSGGRRPGSSGPRRRSCPRHRSARSSSAASWRRPKGATPTAPPALVLGTHRGRAVARRPAQRVHAHRGRGLPAGAAQARAGVVAAGQPGQHRGSRASSPSWAPATGRSTRPGTRMTGSLPAPPIGEYELRVYLAGKLVASAPIATCDVPRVDRRRDRSAGCRRGCRGAGVRRVGAVRGGDRRPAVAVRAGHDRGHLGGRLCQRPVGRQRGPDVAGRRARGHHHLGRGRGRARRRRPGLLRRARGGRAHRGRRAPGGRRGSLRGCLRPHRGRPGERVRRAAARRRARRPPRAPARRPRPSGRPTSWVSRAARPRRSPTENDLRLRVVFEQTDAAPQGTVIAQDPALGRPGRHRRPGDHHGRQPAGPGGRAGRHRPAPRTTRSTRCWTPAWSRAPAPAARPTASGRVGIISTNPRAGRHRPARQHRRLRRVARTGRQPHAHADAPTHGGRRDGARRPRPERGGRPDGDSVPPASRPATGLARTAPRSTPATSSAPIPPAVSRSSAARPWTMSCPRVPARHADARRPTAHPRARRAGVVSVPQVRGMNEDDALTELSGGRPHARRSDPPVQRQRAQRRRHQHRPVGGRPGGPRIDGRLRGVAWPGTRPRLPPPTPTPTPTDRLRPGRPGDLLARIQAAGQIVFNVDVADAPWSSQSSDGTFRGYDVDVARRIARALGVEVVFTSYPLEQVVTGNWGGRFDIAMQHLAITDQRREVLDFSAPYAFDPAQLIATTASGISHHRRIRRPADLCRHRLVSHRTGSTAP